MGVLRVSVRRVIVQVLLAFQCNGITSIFGEAHKFIFEKKGLKRVEFYLQHDKGFHIAVGRGYMGHFRSIRAHLILFKGLPA